MKARMVQPGLTFEYSMWIFTRFSGAALILLGLFGMTSALAMGARTQMDLPAVLRWTFFPNPNHVVNTNIPDVTLGWANAFWQIMQILIVFFGISHGVNGLRMVAEDFTGRTFSRPLLRGTLFMVWIFLLMVSVYVILAS
jgi:succinate dehydrogenase hydrophobic anchor subunit